MERNCVSEDDLQRSIGRSDRIEHSLATTVAYIDISQTVTPSDALRKSNATSSEKSAQDHPTSTGSGIEYFTRKFRSLKPLNTEELPLSVRSNPTMHTANTLTPLRVRFRDAITNESDRSDTMTSSSPLEATSTQNELQTLTSAIQQLTTALLKTPSINDNCKSRNGIVQRDTGTSTQRKIMTLKRPSTGSRTRLTQVKAKQNKTNKRIILKLVSAFSLTALADGSSSSRDLREGRRD